MAETQPRVWVSRDPSKPYYGKEVFVDESGKIIQYKKGVRRAPVSAPTAKPRDVILPTVDISKPRTAGELIREWRKTPGVSYAKLKEAAVREVAKVEPRVVPRRIERVEETIKRWQEDPKRKPYKEFRKQAQRDIVARTVVVGKPEIEGWQKGAPIVQVSEERVSLGKEPFLMGDVVLPTTKTKITGVSELTTDITGKPIVRDLPDYDFERITAVSPSISEKIGVLKEDKFIKMVETPYALEFGKPSVVDEDKFIKMVETPYALEFGKTYEQQKAALIETFKPKIDTSIRIFTDTVAEARERKRLERAYEQKLKPIQRNIEQRNVKLQTEGAILQKSVDDLEIQKHKQIQTEEKIYGTRGRVNFLSEELNENTLLFSKTPTDENKEKMNSLQRELNYAQTRYQESPSAGLLGRYNEIISDPLLANTQTATQMKSELDANIKLYEDEVAQTHFIFTGTATKAADYDTKIAATKKDVDKYNLAVQQYTQTLTDIEQSDKLRLAGQYYKKEFEKAKTPLEYAKASVGRFSVGAAKVGRDIGEFVVVAPSREFKEDVTGGRKIQQALGIIAPSYYVAKGIYDWDDPERKKHGTLTNINWRAVEGMVDTGLIAYSGIRAATAPIKFGGKRTIAEVSKKVAKQEAKRRLKTAKTKGIIGGLVALGVIVPETVQIIKGDETVKGALSDITEIGGKITTVIGAARLTGGLVGTARARAFQKDVQEALRRTPIRTTTEGRVYDSTTGKPITKVAYSKAEMIALQKQKVLETSIPNSPYKVRTRGTWQPIKTVTKEGKGTTYVFTQGSGQAEIQFLKDGKIISHWIKRPLVETYTTGQVTGPDRYFGREQYGLRTDIMPKTITQKETGVALYQDPMTKKYFAKLMTAESKVNLFQQVPKDAKSIDMFIKRIQDMPGGHGLTKLDVKSMITAVTKAKVGAAVKLSKKQFDALLLAQMESTGRATVPYINVLSKGGEIIGQKQIMLQYGPSGETTGLKLYHGVKEVGTRPQIIFGETQSIGIQTISGPTGKKIFIDSFGRLVNKAGHLIDRTGKIIVDSSKAIQASSLWPSKMLVGKGATYRGYDISDTYPSGGKIPDYIKDKIAEAYMRQGIKPIFKDTVKKLFTTKKGQIAIGRGVDFHAPGYKTQYDLDYRTQLVKPEAPTFVTDTSVVHKPSTVVSGIPSATQISLISGPVPLAIEASKLGGIALTKGFASYLDSSVSQGIIPSEISSSLIGSDVRYTSLTQGMVEPISGELATEQFQVGGIAASGVISEAIGGAAADTAVIEEVIPVAEVLTTPTTIPVTPFGIGGGWGFPGMFGMPGWGRPSGFGRGVAEWTVVNPLRDLYREWQMQKKAFKQPITSRQVAQHKMDSMFGRIGKLTDETAMLKTRGYRQPPIERFTMPTMLQQSRLSGQKAKRARSGINVAQKLNTMLRK